MGSTPSTAANARLQILEDEVVIGRDACPENRMPSGAGFDSYFFRGQKSSNSRTAEVIVEHSPRPFAGRRTMFIHWLRECRCESGLLSIWV